MLGRKKPQRPVTLGSCCWANLGLEPRGKPSLPLARQCWLCPGLALSTCCSLAKGIVQALT